MTPSAHFVWQHRTWPAWRWSDERLLVSLGQARLAQGRLLGAARAVGLDLGLEVRADALARETLETAAIEGEHLSPQSVRSSVARRLGLSVVGLPPPDRRIDGLVDMLLDATTRHGEPLDAARVKGWQAALFPTGYSGTRRVRVGEWRATPMHVVSGPLGREAVHFEAPPAARVDDEMARFFEWWARARASMDGLLRAALAHVWFVTIHPFEDGNGRVARAVADMALAQDERLVARLYSVSAQISSERNEYYAVLERTQRGDGEVTEWLEWFLRCLERATAASEAQMDKALQKARFWRRQQVVEIHARQRKVLNRLLEAGPGGFEGGLTTRKYVSMTRASRATAQREIADLLERGLLRRRAAGGRSTSYDLIWEEEGVA